MTERDHIIDTLIHKQYVLESGTIIIEYLYANGREKEGLEFAKRCSCHDDSKFEQEEMRGFTQLSAERTGMKDSSTVMSEQVKRVVAVHWKNNRHHPEHFSDYHNMTEMDIMEMVCDWYSRSKQFGTDFLAFVQERQKNRFQFDDEFFSKVWFYCKVISANDYKDDGEVHTD